MGVAIWFLLAVSADDPREAVRRTMEASVEKQRASVERQRASVRSQVRGEGGSDPFFTVAWATAALSLPAEEDCEPMPRAQVDGLIRDAAQKQGLTPDLLRAVIDKESAFRPCAVSPKGAMGLMQLMPATAEHFGVRDPFDPRQNVDAGTRLLKELLVRYSGDLSLALAAYNAGAKRVDSEGGIPLIPETINYVGEILDRLK